MTEKLEGKKVNREGKREEKEKGKEKVEGKGEGIGSLYRWRESIICTNE